MTLSLREAGPVDAPALVFLHGLWLSSAMWQPQIERLSRDYHCLAPDLPEHGQSTDIGLLTLENTSRVLAHLIRERTAHGRAHVVGLSLGGLAALGLLRDVPEVIDHLLVSGCGTAARLGPIIAAGSLLGKPEAVPRPKRGSMLDPHKVQIQKRIQEDHLYNCETMLERLREQGSTGNGTIRRRIRASFSSAQCWPSTRDPL